MAVIQSVKRTSLAKQLIDEIIASIRSGELPVGKKIPPEAELAELMQVSRNSLREALKTLETFGIIKSVHGQGTFVAENAIGRIPNIEVLHLLSDNNDLQILLDARLVLEPGIAKLAAEHRTDEDIDALSSSLETFVGPDTDLNDMFHIRLSKASKNPVLHGYLQAIFQKLVHTPYPLVQEKLLPEQHEEDLREHRELLDAIIEQDGDAAQELMRMHLKRRFRLLSD
ncbi:MAG: FadR family transcriptional regulator [Oscillospiraceae bacterium]|nr:FadR family transcriptional regulator [Oscillospiraceae bacterium]